MSEIQRNIEHVLKDIPDHVKLIAVSKTKPVELIQQAYNVGLRRFGENKVQELVDKQPLLPEDCQWHMIGHLQRNKVKFLPFITHLIHGVDSLRLLEALQKEAEKSDTTFNCLLQMHIAEEESKFGLDRRELDEILQLNASDQFLRIKICGLMGMATFTDHQQQIEKEFKGLRLLFEEIKQQWFPHSDHFKELSMGMSGDYKIAIAQGSTIVRIGSAIFGNR
ncbi:MAG: YggS family pyridoxal phosphate-dependent enzyme [Flavobacteriales bacterium]